MSVAVPQAPVGTRSPEAPQKFGHGPYFVGQLLSRNQVLQKIRVNPATLNSIVALCEPGVLSFARITLLKTACSHLQQ